MGAETAEFKVKLVNEISKPANAADRALKKLLGSLQAFSSTKDPLAGLRVPSIPGVSRRSEVPTSAAPRARRAGGGVRGGTSSTTAIDREWDRIIARQEKAAALAERQRQRDSAKAEAAAMRAVRAKEREAAQIAREERRLASIKVREEGRAVKAAEVAAAKQMRVEKQSAAEAIKAFNLKNKIRIKQEKAAEAAAGRAKAFKRQSSFGGSLSREISGSDMSRALSVAGSLGTALMGVAVAAGAAAAAVGVLSGAFVAATIKSGSFAQKSELALTQLLHGDAKLAAKEFDEVRKMAADLGLDVQGTTKSFQKLLAAQFEVGQAKDLIRLGADLQAIGATGEEVQRVMLTLTQIKSKGRLQGEELLQLQEAGVSGELVLDALGKQLGKTREEVQKLISAGQVTSMPAIAAIQEAILKKAGSSAPGEVGKNFADSTLDGVIAKFAGRWDNMKIDLGKKIMPGVMAAVDRILPIVDNVSAKIGELFTRLSEDPKVQRMMDNMLFEFERFGAWIDANWSGISGGIVAGIGMVGDAFQWLQDNSETIQTVLAGIAIGLGVLAVGAGLLVAPFLLLGAVLVAVVFAIAEGVNFLIEAVPRWVQAGSDMVMGLVNGIISGAGAVISAVTSVASSAWDAFTGFLGISSPSLLFATSGAEIPAGIAMGVNDNAGTAQQAVDSMTASLVPTDGMLLPANDNSFGAASSMRMAAGAEDFGGSPFVAPAANIQGAPGALAPANITVNVGGQVFNITEAGSAQATAAAVGAAAGGGLASQLESVQLSGV